MTAQRETIKARASQFRPGDKLPSGQVVLGIDGFVRGGVRVAFTDGTRATLNGRYKHEVQREIKETTT
jgi:hypothetical protein